MNKTKLTQIVFTSIAFVSIVITILIINNKSIDLTLKRLNYTLIESIVKRRPKIFCMITTRVENHKRKAVHVKNTWAKRCDQFLFLSSENEPYLPAIKVCDKDDRSHLWCKVRNQCSNQFVLNSKPCDPSDKVRSSLYSRPICRSLRLVRQSR